MSTDALPFELVRTSKPEDETAQKAIKLVKLRKDLDLYQGTLSLEGHPTWVIHDKFKKKYYNIGQIEYEILSRWDLNHPQLIAQNIIDTTAYYATEQDVIFLNDYLSRHELSEFIDEEVREKISENSRNANKVGIRARLMKYVIINMRLARPDTFLTNTLWIFKFAFTRTFWAVMVGMMILNAYLISQNWPTFKSSISSMFSFQGALGIFFALAISKVMHEFGHAYTCKYFGLKVPTFGFRLMMYILPFFFTDTADSWRLKSRTQRLKIGLSGLLSELILATIAGLAWSLLDDGIARSICFYVAVVSFVASLAINSTPFLKWDGYYIFSDLIGVQNLQQRGFDLGKWQLREWLFGWKKTVPTRFTPFLHKVVVLYAYGSWIKRFFIFMFIGLLIFQRVFKVLGIFLLALQMSAFILMPVSKEVKHWIEHRKDMSWNRHSITTLLVLISLLALFVIPWQSTIKLSSLITPRVSATLYAPAAAQIKQSFVEPNMKVTEGQLLVELGNLDLEYQIRLAKLDVDIFRSQMNRFGSQAYFETMAITAKQLQAATERTNNLIETYKELEIRAPFDGEVITRDYGLHPGNWFEERSPLLTVADKSTLEAYAYVSEQDLIRVGKSTAGVFYPEDPGLEPINLSVVEIDKTETHDLSHPLLDLVNGGTIETVRETLLNDEAISKPTTTHYRIRLAMDPNKIDDVKLVIRGTLHLDGEKISMAKKLWIKVVSILIRESGF